MSDEEPELAPIDLPGARTPRPAPERARPRTSLPKDLIDGYELLDWLGEGTMGAVFRARQLSLDRPVAVKVLTPRLAKNQNFLNRFLREARAVAKLNHPNVVSGIDVGESKGYRYFVMEFVEGPTLQQLLDSPRPPDPMESTKIVLQVARALDHAHRSNLIHRDVKPANIIITSKSGVAKLCDLGLAKEVDETGSDTAEGRAMGTPFYISPEQARGQADIDIRSDLYSLGATWYHAVCGRPPYTGPTPAVIMAKHLTEALTPVRKLRPDAPRGCPQVIERMLRKKREERYQAPSDLIRDIEAIVDGTFKEEAALRPRRRVRRRRFR